MRQGRVRCGILLLVLLLFLPLAFALALQTELTSIGAGLVSVSRAMMVLRISCRTRGYVEGRAACMSRWRLRSSSSMAFWTTAIFTRSDRTSPQVRAYLRIFTLNSSSEPRTSPLAVAGSYSATVCASSATLHHRLHVPASVAVPICCTTALRLAGLWQAKLGSWLLFPTTLHFRSSRA